jgi:type IV pilus assembly protein PilA
MLKNLKKQQEGFTIIEVMIVLVIAAVILLIVFIAVPALQRNSRNTQRKNEAANLLSAAGEYSSNKSGAVPAAGASTTTGSDAAGILALVKTSNITTLNVQAATGSAGAAVTVAPAATLTSATLVTNADCNGAAVKVGTSTRQVALVYQVEDGGGNGTNACVASGL